MGATGQESIRDQGGLLPSHGGIAVYAGLVAWGELPETVGPQILRPATGATKREVSHIDDGGTVIGDSSFIIDYLKATYGDRLGENAIKPEARAIALSVRRMLEEHLYWVIVYMAWMEDPIWEESKRMMFDSPGSAEIEAMREGVRRDLYGQGLGRHSRSEVYALGSADLTALSDFLQDKPYALGERPTELDATVYAFLGQILACPYETPMKMHFWTLPNLEAYCRRMHTQFYSPNRVIKA